jgi:hypothetical protein
MTGQAPLRYRPHHFLCSLGFEGKGYSDAFTRNMTAIVMGRLRAAEGDATEIAVIDSLDDICTPCPKKRGAACASQDQIARLDQAHASALALEPGQILTWAEAKDRIRQNVAPGALKTLCAGCQWEPFGMCARAVQALSADGPAQQAVPGAA